MSSLIELKINDNDKKQKWNGSILTTPPAYKVKNLQKDLKTIGTYTEKVDGDFGRKTEKALKLFQWACSNLNKCINQHSHSTTIIKKTIAISGTLNQASYDELTLRVKSNQFTTGDLVRIVFSDLTNIEAGSGFKKIQSTSVFKDELVISKDAVQLIKDMDSNAKEKNITIKVNQALRIFGQPVTGAVVTPATKSQHLIGHAIDCNIVDGNNWNNSATFKEGKETKSAKDYIKELKSLKYRWGGDFNTPDTPHFDKQVLSSDFSYEAKFFFNQRMISLSHPIAKEVI